MLVLALCLVRLSVIVLRCRCCCQAGLRAVHDLGPEIRRAISGNLEEEELVERRGSEEPMHRVRGDDLRPDVLPPAVPYIY